MDREARSRRERIVPTPVDVEPTEPGYEIDSGTEIRYRGDGAREAATYLAERFRDPTGYRLPIVETDSPGSATGISLACSDDLSLPDEGYRLTTSDSGVAIRAPKREGLVMGIGTLRQLLPPEIERSAPVDRDEWAVPGVTISDAPRFEYRGVNLDVARHFFGVEDVKTFVEWISLYKLNHLHLHLTNNTGWRLEVDEWPALTAVGGRTDIDGESGGYYTAAEYRELVEYARRRGITVVPEIDVPAHVGAAVAAYPDLDASDGERSLPLGKSDSAALAVGEERTEAFVADVIGAVADLTPGPYVHFGGDEASHVSAEAYADFVGRVARLIEDHGKTPVAWGDAVGGDVPVSTVVQYWKESDLSVGGYACILSPRDHAYLNFRYDEETPPDGPETWGRRVVSVRDSYEWEPGSYVEEIVEGEGRVIGVEAALWSEEIATMDDLGFMTFPRLPGIAERGWSRPSDTGWDAYRHRLAAQAPRWDALGIAYHRSPEVPWVE